MTSRRGWALIATGVLLDTAVILLPLTPYPLIQMALDRDYYDAQRGYEQFLNTGKWEAGDPGFALMQRHYMEDVTKGMRPELSTDIMAGASLFTFQIEPQDKAPGVPANKRKVYVVYSTRTGERGDIVEGDAIKTITGTFREPYAMLLSAVLVLAGTVLVYFGLERTLARTTTAGAIPAAAGEGEIALSRTGAS